MLNFSSTNYFMKVKDNELNLKNGGFSFDVNEKEQQKEISIDVDLWKKQIYERNKTLPIQQRTKLVFCVDCNKPLEVSINSNSPTPRCDSCKEIYEKERRRKARERRGEIKEVQVLPPIYEGNNLCEYGCGQKANYILSNGKLCCSTSYNKCPEIRRKNSEGLLYKHSETSEDNNFKKWNGSKENKEVLQKNNELRLQESYENAKKEFKKDNPLSSGYLRRMMVEAFHIEQKCLCCGLKEWNNHPIPLEVHHKDGDSTNNEISNLEFLCLNCHALTDTFRGKNMGNQGFKKVLDEDLIEALKNSTSIRQALVIVGLAPKGGNYSRAYELMSKNNISLKK